MEGVRQFQRFPAPRQLGAQSRRLRGASGSLAGPSDEGARGLTALRQKMTAYQANGARLGWLLIPHDQAVEVWSTSGEPQRLEGCERLEAGPEFPGLQLQLSEIWAG